MSFSDFINTIKDRLGLTPRRKIEKLERQAKPLQLLAYLDAPETDLQKKALDALKNLAFKGLLPEREREMVLDKLEALVQIRQQLRIRSIQDPAEVQRITANEYFARGNYYMAVCAMEWTLGLKMQDAGLMNNLAQAYSLQGEEIKARETWHSLLALYPEDQRALEMLPQSYCREAKSLLNEDNSNPEIIELLSKALQINPTYAETSVLMGRYYAGAGEHLPAADSYRAAILLGTAPAGYDSVARFQGEVSFCAAESYKMAGNFARAVEYYDRALKVYPVEPEMAEEIKKFLAECKTFLAEEESNKNSQMDSQVIEPVEPDTAAE